MRIWMVLVGLFILIAALPAVCGSISSAAVSGGAVAADLKQQEIEQQQDLFEDVNPDMAYGMREMRLQSQDSNAAIVRVAESGDRSQTAIAYATPVSLGLVLLIVLGVAWIIARAGKQTKEVA